MKKETQSQQTKKSAKQKAAIDHVSFRCSGCAGSAAREENPFQDSDGSAAPIRRPVERSNQKRAHSPEEAVCDVSERSPDRLCAVGTSPFPPTSPGQLSRGICVAF